MLNEKTYKADPAYVCPKCGHPGDITNSYADRVRLVCPVNCGQEPWKKAKPRSNDQQTVKRITTVIRLSQPKSA